MLKKDFYCQYRKEVYSICLIWGNIFLKKVEILKKYFFYNIIKLVNKMTKILIVKKYFNPINIRLMQNDNDFNNQSSDSCLSCFGH